MCGVLRWADVNAATPPGSRGRSALCAAAAGPIYDLGAATSQETSFTQQPAPVPVPTTTATKATVAGADRHSLSSADPDEEEGDYPDGRVNTGGPGYLSVDAGQASAATGSAAPDVGAMGRKELRQRLRDAGVDYRDARNDSELRALLLATQNGAASF